MRIDGQAELTVTHSHSSRTNESTETTMISQHSTSTYDTRSEFIEDGVALDREPTRLAGHRRRRPIVGGALALMLVLAACGSDGSDGANATADADKTVQAPTGDEATDSSAASAGGTGTGTIEIGDVKHDLTVTRCMNMFDTIGGDAASVSEPDNVDVTFEFSPNDWRDRDASEGWTEDGTVRLDSEDPYEQWETGASMLEQYNLPGGAQASDFEITSYEISDDGQSVTGEAQFVELNALLAGTMTEPTTGTFSFSCPPEG